MSLELKTNFKPSGDQPEAIASLVEGVFQGKKNQVLLGVTGSGKTFTIANVINQIQRPVLVLSHNKTLASQLFSELKSFFPNNNVEYFVSYFDYYRPEAYMPKTDVYVEKTSKTNHDLEMMRMSTMNSLLTSRDTIVVASVAAIYGANKPEEYESSFFTINLNQNIKRQDFFLNLIQMQYKRNQISIETGEFSVKGDVIEIAPGWTNEFNLRIELFDDQIESINKIDPLTKKTISKESKALIFPASSYVVESKNIDGTIELIELELEDRLKQLKKEDKLLEYQRLKDRTKNDIDSLKEFGYCSGIENYSRHIDRRKENEKPYTLLDYLPKDTLLIIDESHMMIPQLHGMYNGDRARKLNLVEYGFRLPSALDNRPLRFDEFEKYDFQKIFISATPADYELNLTHGEIVTQYIRPTGLLDPIIEIHPSKNQVNDMYDEIQKQIKQNLRTIIVTTTKKTAEELTKYFQSKKIKIAYIHSEHKTLERNEILRKLRKGIYDVIIGINLLREGIDLPEAFIGKKLRKSQDTLDVWIDSGCIFPIRCNRWTPFYLEVYFSALSDLWFSIVQHWNWHDSLRIVCIFQRYAVFIRCIYQTIELPLCHFLYRWSLWSSGSRSVFAEPHLFIYPLFSFDCHWIRDSSAMVSSAHRSKCADCFGHWLLDV